MELLELWSGYETTYLGTWDLGCVALAGVVQTWIFDFISGVGESNTYIPTRENSVNRFGTVCMYCECEWGCVHCIALR